MLVPLAPFLAVGAAVVAGLALIITAIQSVREKFDQAPGMLSKLKLIVAAIITAPYVLFQKIAVFIAEKLGFTKFAEAFGSIDFVQEFMNFFSNIGAKIKGLFPASVFQFLEGLDIEAAIINKVTELRESLFGAIGNIFGSVGLGLTTLKNDILGFLADILEKFTFLGIGPKIAKFIRGATEQPEETTTPVETREEGGPVKKGGLYLVGEKGPELFKPNMGGMVANQAKTQNIMQTGLDSVLGRMGGGGGQITTTNVVNNSP